MNRDRFASVFLEFGSIITSQRIFSLYFLDIFSIGLDSKWRHTFHLGERTHFSSALSNSLHGRLNLIKFHFSRLQISSRIQNKMIQGDMRGKKMKFSAPKMVLTRRHERMSERKNSCFWNSMTLSASQMCVYVCAD